MVATFRNLTGTGDLPLAVQTALGIGASIPFSCPVLTIALSNGDALTIQDDGKIAIYRAIGFDYHLISCQCQGEVINEIPRVAQHIISLDLMGNKYRLYRHNDEYFSFEGDTFTHFKNYPLTLTTQGIQAELSETGCEKFHKCPALEPKEYREAEENQDLVKDRRHPRDRPR